MSRIIDFDNIKINKDYILARVSEAEIFEHYLKHDFQLGKLYKSPLRDDKNPNFNIYKLNGELRYKDFGYTAGNCFEFVRNLFNCDYPTSLQIIANDFSLAKKTTQVLQERKPNPIIEELEKFQKKLIPVRRAWKKIDFDYWNSYHIPLINLNNERIYACNYVYLKKDIDTMFMWGQHLDSDPIYCYDFINTHKCYRPLTKNKKLKWISTTTAYDVQGLTTLPERGEVLIITSSMKDLLVLKLLGYNAIAPHGEGHNIPERIMDSLWSSFDNILLLYDNDEAGKTSTRRFIKNNPGVSPIYFPEDAEKDISDHGKVHGLEEARDLMNKLV